MRKNNRAARAARTLVQFFDVGFLTLRCAIQSENGTTCLPCKHVSLQAPKIKMADEVFSSNYISRSVSTIGANFELLCYTVQRLLKLQLKVSTCYSGFKVPCFPCTSCSTFSVLQFWAFVRVSLFCVILFEFFTHSFSCRCARRRSTLKDRPTMPCVRLVSRSFENVEEV